MTAMHHNVIAIGTIRVYKMSFLTFHPYNHCSLLFSTHILLNLLVYFCCCVKFVAEPWHPKELKSLILPRHLHPFLKMFLSSKTIFSFQKPMLKNISRLKTSRWWRRDHLVLKIWKSMKNWSSCWERGCMRLNNVIKETNQSNGLDIYANVALRPFKDYTSYMQGKSINYSPSKINFLLHL